MIWFDIGETLFFADRPMRTPGRQLGELLVLKPLTQLALGQWLWTTDIRSASQFANQVKQWCDQVGTSVPDHLERCCHDIWQQQTVGSSWSRSAVCLLTGMSEKKLPYGFISNIWHPYFQAFRDQHPELVDGRPQLLSYQQSFAKPNLGLFRLAMQGQQKEVFIVGDSYYKDIVPGYLSGMSTIYAGTANSRRPIPQSYATYTISALEQIQAIIKRHELQAPAA